uniref:Deacetylase sirtuin-type domain-containing protein n=1 Tax=Grammatophora oceanica TaxID=210454 RepID=A0A7S1YB06_9STRA
MAGAGMSVSSGIPDFRSAGGLYDTLRPELLTASEVEQEAMRMDATVALDHGLFLQNPLPCLEVNRPFILGTRSAEWKATLAHRFVELLHQKTGKLTRLYTQNIDGLESQCHKLPSSKVIPVHGSFDRAECATCGDTSDFGAFCDAVEKQIKDIAGQDSDAPTKSTPIICDVCGHASVKPSIVLFRSPLPKLFFDSVPNDVRDVDLLIVIGTSLAVAPANTIVFRVPKTAMRVVVNREPVGFRLGLDYGDDPKRDFFARGNCDDVLLDLMVALGWLDDLRGVLGDLPESGKQLLEQRFRESAETASTTQAAAARIGSD